MQLGSSVVLLHAARVFDYFVVTEIAFMDNQTQINETTSRLDSEKVSFLRACLRKNRPVISDQKINFPYILGC